MAGCPGLAPRGSDRRHYHGHQRDEDHELLDDVVGRGAGLALAWVLSCEDVTAALVAPRKPEQFTMVDEALRLRLDPDERDKLSSLVI